MKSSKNIMFRQSRANESESQSLMAEDEEIGRKHDCPSCASSTKKSLMPQNTFRNSDRTAHYMFMMSIDLLVSTIAQLTRSGLLVWDKKALHVHSPRDDYPPHYTTAQYLIGSYSSAASNNISNNNNPDVQAKYYP